MKKLLFCFSMLFCLSNVVNAECNECFECEKGAILEVK